MAITIVSQPPDKHPAYNPAEFVISTNSVAPAFRFYIEIQDMDDNLLTSPLRLPKEPNANTCRLDVSPFVRTYINNLLTEEDYEDLPNGILEYQIKIGEESIYSWQYDDYIFNSAPGTPWNGYTNLISTNDHIFTVGSQINIIQADGGALKPMLTGLFTVVAVPNSKQVTLNITFGAVGSGAAVAGIVSYSDNRKIIVPDLAEETKETYNGAFESNYFVREVVGNEFTTTPRKLATNLKSGFRVMPNFTMWINTFLWGITPTLFKQEDDNGNSWQTNFTKSSEAMQFKADGSGVVDNSRSVSIFLGNGGGILSEQITLDIWRGCPVDFIELLYCDRFGSYLPFYFRQVNEEKTEAIREQLTDRYGADLVIGAKQQRSWMLRSDVLNDVELELFNILLTSPDVRMKIDGYYERVMVTTNSAQRARNSVQKRKEIDVRLAQKDEINV